MKIVQGESGHHKHTAGSVPSRAAAMPAHSQADSMRALHRGSL